MAFTTFTAGTVAKAAEVNANFWSVLKLQNEKVINDVTATASGVLAGSSQKLIDKFLDSTGQNNTVDTVNTTALFNTSYYECNQFIVPNPVGEPGFDTVTGWTYSDYIKVIHK